MHEYKVTQTILLKDCVTNILTGSLNTFLISHWSDKQLVLPHINAIAQVNIAVSVFAKSVACFYHSFAFLGGINLTNTLLRCLCKKHGIWLF